MTLEEIGQLLGVTRERVRQIEAKALRKLRPPCFGTEDWMNMDSSEKLEGTSGNLVFTHAKYIKPRIQQSHSDFSWASRSALNLQKLSLGKLKKENTAAGIPAVEPLCRLHL